MKPEGGGTGRRAAGSGRAGENEESEEVSLRAARGTRREAGFIPDTRDSSPSVSLP